MVDFRRMAAFLVSVLLVLASASAEAVCRMGPSCGDHGSSSAARAESAPEAVAGHACCGEKGTKPAPRVPDCPSAGDCCAVSSDLPEAPATVTTVGLSTTTPRGAGSAGPGGVPTLVPDPVSSPDSALAEESQRGSAARGRPTPLPLYLLDLSLRN